MINIQFDAVLKNALVATVLDEYEEDIIGMRTDGKHHVSNVTAHYKNDDSPESADFATEVKADEDGIENCTVRFRVKNEKEMTSNCPQHESEGLSTDEGDL